MKKNLLLLFSSLAIMNMSALAQELPCKSKFSDGQCKARYREDENGQIHGKYISYFQNGSVYERGSYVHGNAQGNWESPSEGEYTWYEKGKRIIVSDSPISSYAHALQLVKKREEKYEQEEAKRLKSANEAKIREEEEKKKQQVADEIYRQKQLIIARAADSIARVRYDAEAAQRAREKPIVTQPQSIKFMVNSYTIKPESKYQLQNLGAAMAAYNNNTINDKITDIYIITHAHKGLEDDPEDVKRQEKILFFLSANRGIAVKNILETGLVGVKFHIIPASTSRPIGSTSSVNNRTEIFYETNSTVQISQAAAKETGAKYKILDSNGELKSNNIIINDELRKALILNVQGLTNRRKIQAIIPVELWKDEYSKGEEDVQKFKNKIIGICGNEERAAQYVIQAI